MKKTLIILAGILLAWGITPVDAFESAEDLRVTVLYDNTSAVEGVESNWGFSCLIEGTEKKLQNERFAGNRRLQRIIDGRTDALSSSDDGRAVSAVLDIIDRGPAAAMGRFNRRQQAN